MDPKPNMVILQNNSGFTPEVAQNISAALREIGVKPENVYWRTTTYVIPVHKLGQNKTVFVGTHKVYELMCNHLRCIDFEFTSTFHRDHFADYRHFLEPAKRIMNEVILQNLGVLPQDCQQLDKAIATKPHEEGKRQW